jgi:hypothetical protein
VAYRAELPIVFSWLLWAPKLWLPRLAIQLQGQCGRRSEEGQGLYGNRT